MFNEAFFDGGAFHVDGGKPSRVKKMTGTRLSKVLDCNHWATPFQAWCEIMKVAEPPFEGNKYTAAGQAIEPKLIDFCKDIVSPYIASPVEYFNDTKKRYDFFTTNRIFGGMWDALAFASDKMTCNDDTQPIAVIEAKTSSRPQDWENGVPDNYKIQGMMYAALLACEDVYFPVAFLAPEDYEHPEDFVCDETNTRVFHIKTTDKVGRFDNIYEALHEATEWWNTHIDGNVAPPFDERKDKEYLALIRQVDISNLTIDTSDLQSLCVALYEADSAIDALKAQCGLDEWEKKRKDISTAINSIVKPMLEEVTGKDSLDTEYYTFKVSTTRKTNYDALEEDGLLDKYVTESKSVRTTRK